MEGLFFAYLVLMGIGGVVLLTSGLRAAVRAARNNKSQIANSKETEKAIERWRESAAESAAGAGFENHGSE